MGADSCLWPYEGSYKEVGPLWSYEGSYKEVAPPWSYEGSYKEVGPLWSYLREERVLRQVASSEGRGDGYALSDSARLGAVGGGSVTTHDNDVDELGQWPHDLLLAHAFPRRPTQVLRSHLDWHKPPSSHPCDIRRLGPS